MAERACMVELYAGAEYARRCSRRARRAVRLADGNVAELCYQHLRLARRRGAFLVIGAGPGRFYAASHFAGDSEAIQ